MVTAEEKKFATIIQAKLHEKFRDDFEFEPILVQSELNLDGVGYLHAYIVFAGDQKKPDPAWTAALPRLLWPYAQELGCPGLPPCSPLSKSRNGRVWRRLYGSAPG